MKERLPANPYREADFDALYDACQRRAGELLNRKRVVRTPEERAALALDTAHLLLAVAATLRDNDIYSMAGAWKATREDDILTAFVPLHEHAIVGARYRTLRAATDAVFAGKQSDWYLTTFIEGSRAYDLALSSEEGLLRVMEYLQGLQNDRRKR
jgi:hypothetical protein